MINIQENLKSVLDEIPQNVRLIAISKFHPKEAITEAYNMGQRCFGESKVQELQDKHENLPSDIEWHFIGHLQSNKVKYIAPYIAMIHAVDSYKLLEEIDKQAAKANRTIPCLLEIHIAQEESKFGFSFENCKSMLENNNWKELKHISICGVMGMATNTDNMDEIKKEFDSLKYFFQDLKSTYFKNCESFKEISMGMSHDFKIAIESGSTLVRVGSKIFGERTY